MTKTELMLSLLMEFKEERLPKYINARKALSKSETCFSYYLLQLVRRIGLIDYETDLGDSVA